MTQIFGQDLIISGSGDAYFSHDLFINGNIKISGSGDLELNSAIVNGDIFMSGTGDFIAHGILIAHNMVMSGSRDAEGDFIILRSYKKSGSGDLSGRLSASNFAITGSGDIYAERASLTPKAKNSFLEFFRTFSLIPDSDLSSFSGSVQEILSKPFDYLSRQGITINIRGDYIAGDKQVICGDFIQGYKMGDVGMTNVDNKGGLIQRSSIGSTEGRIGICPYCGKELNFPKQPRFCPYCKEQIMK